MKQKKNYARRFFTLLMVMILCLGTLVLPASASRNAAAHAANAVVRVVMVDPLTNSYLGFGSAFGLAATESEAPQYFVTNKHVVNADYQISETQTMTFKAVQIYLMKSDLAVTYNARQGQITLESSQLIPCEVVYESEEYPDMAILRAAEPFTGRTSLPLRVPTEEKDRGNTVYALGFPAVNDETNFSLENYAMGYPADVEDVSITQGVFSHMAPMKIYGNYVHIEHDARINHGNSGGPLIDENGAVIGINTYGWTESYVTSFYSVSSQYIISACESLNIPYRVADSSSGNTLMFAVIAAGVVLLAAAGILVVVQNKKKKKPVAGPVMQGQAGPVGLQIRAESGVFAGKTMTVTATVNFGRKAAVNQVCFPEGTGGVSGEHCRIFKDNRGGYYLEDLGSTYGTFVNNQKLAPNTPVQLTHGMQFHLGSQEQSFRVL